MPLQVKKINVDIFVHVPSATVMVLIIKPLPEGNYSLPPRQHSVKICSPKQKVWGGEKKTIRQIPNDFLLL